jgi:hypothetical protein
MCTVQAPHAAFLRAGQREHVTQAIEQRHARIDFNGVRRAVDQQADRHRGAIGVFGWDQVWAHLQRSCAICSWLSVARGTLTHVDRAE